MEAWAKPKYSKCQPAPSGLNKGKPNFNRLAVRITGSGPNNRIIAADVEEAKLQPKAAAGAAPARAPAAAAKPAELPSTAAAYEDFENSQIRKVIAERLTYSK